MTILQPPYRILIVGASGLVGGQSQLAFASAGHRVLGTHFSYPTPSTVYLDTLSLDAEAIAALEAQLGGPAHYILHCGALTHVDYCEQHPDESERLTVSSTLRLIELAQRWGSRLAYVGTDYVFDGARGPYIESDAVNPLSVYARHKLAAEQAVLATPYALAVRITNVYGDEARGKNFVARVAAQLADALQTGLAVRLRLPADQYATPINAADVARALLTLIQANEHGLWHLASTDWVNRIQLAQRIARYYPSAPIELIAVPTVELAQPAARPLLGGLIAKKFLDRFPEFQFTNLDDYLSGATAR
jgi:dTDP-4-dehydrorhamnose reductase